MVRLDNLERGSVGTRTLESEKNITWNAEHESKIEERGRVTRRHLPSLKKCKYKLQTTNSDTIMGDQLLYFIQENVYNTIIHYTTVVLSL